MDRCALESGKDYRELPGSIRYIRENVVRPVDQVLVGDDVPGSRDAPGLPPRFPYAVHQGVRAQSDGRMFLVRVVSRKDLGQIRRHVLQQPARDVQGEHRRPRPVRAQAALPAEP